MIPIYVTLEEAKRYLGYEDDDQFDGHLEVTIPALSEMCDHLTGRVYGSLGRGFEAHEVSFSYQLVNPKPGVILPEWPIIDVVSITLDDRALEEDDYILDSRTGYVQFVADGGYPMDRAGIFKITVNAGYATLPSAVGLAVLRAVSYVKQRRDEEGLGAELLGPQQTTWRATISRGNAEISDIISAHLAEFVLDVSDPPKSGVIV